MCGTLFFNLEKNQGSNKSHVYYYKFSIPQSICTEFYSIFNFFGSVTTKIRTIAVTLSELQTTPCLWTELPCKTFMIKMSGELKIGQNVLTSKQYFHGACGKLDLRVASYVYTHTHARALYFKRTFHLKYRGRMLTVKPNICCAWVHVL